MVEMPEKNQKIVKNQENANIFVAYSSSHKFLLNFSIPRALWSVNYTPNELSQSLKSVKTMQWL